MYLMQYMVGLWSLFPKDIKGLLVLREWSGTWNRNTLRTAKCREPYLTRKVPWDTNCYSLEEHLGKVVYICNLCLAFPLSYCLIWQCWRQCASPAFGLTWLNWSQFSMLCPDLVNKKGCDLEVDFEYDFVGFAMRKDCWTFEPQWTQ